MLLIQDREIIFPQTSLLTSKKQVTARPNYDPFQYLLNNTWVTDQPRFHVAISDDNNNWSLELPWPSESNPHTVIWTIERTDGSIIFGTVPEGVAGPVSVYQLLNTYNWSIQTGPENVFTPASLSQNADFSTINLSALNNQIFVTPNGTLSWSPTLSRVITFPDVSGTVLTTGNLNAITGAITVDSLTVQTPNISTIGITVKGTLGQVADLQEWQDSTGGVLAKIAANGALDIPNSGLSISGVTSITRNPLTGVVTWALQNVSGANLVIVSGASGSTPLVARSAVGQTADLQQWQDSTGAMLASVARTGVINGSGFGFGNAGGISATFIRDNSTGKIDLTLQNFPGAGVTIIGANAATVPFAIQSAPSQTADLQQWQDSTGGTIFAKVTSRGDIHTNVIGAATTAPGLIQFDNAAAFRISDGFDGLQSASGHRTQLFGYWGLMLQGNIQNVLGAPTYVAGTADHFGVIIPTAWAGDVGLIVQGSPSQSADLQQWQDSTGAVLTSIDASGNLRTNNNIYGNYLQANQLFVYTSTATTLGLVIHGQASQTADLFQAQDSTNAVKARIDPSGAIAPQNGARITSGIGAPTTPGGINPTTGDLYIRTDLPSTANSRLYMCSVGGATPTWVALV